MSGQDVFLLVVVGVQLFCLGGIANMVAEHFSERLRDR